MRGPSGLPGQVPRAGADADGAVAPRVGRDRGARPGAGRHHAGVARNRHLDVDDHPGAQRVAVARSARRGARAAAGWGPQANCRQGSHAAARPRGPGRADRLGRPGVAPALDRKERAATGSDTADHGAPGQSPIGGRVVDRRRVQLAGQPEDTRRAAALRPRRPVPSPRRAGPPVPGRGAAGGLRRHQEEGIGGRLQERGPRVAPGGPTGTPCGCTTF